MIEWRWRDKVTHETKRTNLGGKCGRGTDLTTGGTEVDDLDFVGVLLGRSAQAADDERDGDYEFWGHGVGKCPLTSTQVPTTQYLEFRLRSPTVQLQTPTALVVLCCPAPCCVFVQWVDGSRKGRIAGRLRGRTNRQPCPPHRYSLSFSFQALPHTVI